MTAAHELQALYAIWLREMKVFTREKSRIVGAIVTPLILIGAIGTGFGATMGFKSEALAGVSYTDFLFPGILAMGVLFGTIFYGLNIVWDRKLDVLKEVLVAPVSRTTIFFGKVVGGSTQSIAQTIVLLAFGMVLYDIPLSGAALALLFAALLAISFVSVGLFLGSLFDSFEGFQFVVSFVTFPLFFLSGAFFPLDGLPPWLAIATRLDPAAYAVDGLRGATLGTFAFDPILDLAVISAFGLTFVLLGTWAFKRMK